MMSRTGRRVAWTLGALALALSLAVGARLASNRASAPVGGATAGRQAPVPGPQQSVAGVELAPAGRPYQGPEDAPVTIVEFTDYQCPFCRRHFETTLPLILQDYGDVVKYVLRNFPIAQLHPDAERAAQAAECALDQGRFWEYHDLLFRNSSAVDAGSLKRYADEIGLDGQSFAACLDSGEKRPVVERDLEDARRLNLRGTPTFFINGHILVGAQPYPVFRAYIEAALDEAG